MGIFNRRDKNAEMTKAIESALEKAGLMGTPMQGAQGYVNTTVNQPAMQEALLMTPGSIQAPLPRSSDIFGSQLGPAAPFLPTPLDPVLDETGRALPRRYEYLPATNLDLTLNTQSWTLLRKMSEQCDIINRCIMIRINQIISQDWSFTISDDAVRDIMASENVSSSKAAKIGRERFADTINRLQMFWDNPYPQGDRGFAEWMTELLWQHFPFDGVAIYPRYSLGGDILGFEIIDSPTIKVLLDNRGDQPRPPSPAFQQILWGFPRGEYQASQLNDGEFYSGEGLTGEFKTDQLAYFVRNRRTWSPYGYSTVEAALPAATLYLERQRWMKSEYIDGTMPQTFMETDGDEMDPQRLMAMERILNDQLAGQAAQRHRIKMLPKGMRPTFAPNLDERYKETYDEFLIKRIGSVFGVAPSALGVVPRSGLGGRGQQEGEQDQSEIEATRPLEQWLTDIINSLSRRFLGVGREVTIIFSGGESKDNSSRIAKANQDALFSGQKVFNDVRGELGLPLFDIPEADEPFVMTPGGGIVFLRGQLAAQEAEAIKQSEGVTNALSMVESETQQGAQGAEGETTESSPRVSSQDIGKSEAAQTELRAFNRFVKRRMSDETWRDFEFEVIAKSVADELNHAAKLAVFTQSRNGLAKKFESILSKEITDIPLPKGRLADLPSEELRQRIERHYEPLILEALKNLVTNIDEIADLARNNKSPVSRSGRALARSVIRINSKELARLLQSLYRDSYLAGSHIALNQLPSGASLGAGLAELVAGINWGTWKPGGSNQAAQLQNGGLKQMLDSANITLKGLTNTTINQIGDILGQHLANGGTPKEMANAIQSYVNDSWRATLIAETEAGRAMIQATVDTYMTNGYQQFEWVAYDDACEECAAMQDANPHDVTDATPPQHPGCRCYINPVLN